MRFITRLLVAAAVATAAACSPSAEKKAPETAAVSPLVAEADEATRKALVGALTPAIEKDLAQDVTLGVEIARTMGADGVQWGWVSGRAEAPDGGAVDIEKTHYAEQAKEGLFDGPNVNALLQRKGDAWTVVAFDVGSTDVAWAAWPQKFRAPPEVMGFETAEGGE